MNPPFRLKLTLWYSAFLAAALIVFSTAVYLLMAHLLLDNLNSSLRTRADQVATSAELREGHLGLTQHDEGSEGTFIPAALVTPSGHIAAGQVPPTVRAWLTRNAGSLHSGFQTSHLGTLQIASESIDRASRLAGYVLVWQPLESVDKARHSLLLVILTLGPALLVIAGLGGWSLAGRSLAPVVRVTETASVISASDLSRRVKVGAAQDELSRLATTFNAMIDRLEAAVERERRFTADASHELRGPLAVIRAETTLALDRPRAADEYRHALNMIDEQTEAMEELVTELLLLARVESSPQQREAVRLSSAVNAAVDECRIRMEQRKVRVDVDVPEELLVRGSPTLLARAIRNLVDNAITVSAPGDSVSVRAGREGDRLVLIVQDNGPGIADEHQEHIFEPFYQVSPARTPGESHGLGLAICRRIVCAHGGQVEVRSTAGEGACFRIDLPAAKGGAREPVDESVAQSRKR